MYSPCLPESLAASLGPVRRLTKKQSTLISFDWLDTPHVARTPHHTHHCNAGPRDPVHSRYTARMHLTNKFASFPEVYFHLNTLRHQLGSQIT
jgi:hypothetical protein